MTRSKLRRLAHELHAEPRAHSWTRRVEDLGNLVRASVDQHCARVGCDWVWMLGHAEPTIACRGTDPETADTDARRNQAGGTDAR